MTTKKAYIKHYGKEGYRKLPNSLKKLIREIESLPLVKNPISANRSKKALAA